MKLLLKLSFCAALIFGMTSDAEAQIFNNAPCSVLVTLYCQTDVPCDPGCSSVSICIPGMGGSVPIPPTTASSCGGACSGWAYAYICPMDAGCSNICNNAPSDAVCFGVDMTSPCGFRNPAGPFGTGGCSCPMLGASYSVGNLTIN